VDKRIIRSKIDVNSEGVRLDLWLTRRFTYQSRNQWQEIIKKGQILLNENKCRGSRILRAGDNVSFIADKAEPDVDSAYSVIYEDEYFLLIDKPGNLPCHPAGPFFRNTLWHMLSDKYGKTSMVNRLDRETSGLVIAAKTSEAAKEFAKLFTKGNIVKIYTALVFGRFPDECRAKGWLAPDKESAVRKKRRFSLEKPEGAGSAENCETNFALLGTCGEFSAVEATLKTGRLHQIRATLFSLGYPLPGDKLYGPDDEIYLRFPIDAMTENDWEKLVLPRQALHARQLAFKHPFTSENMEFKIQPPADIRALYERCMGV